MKISAKIERGRAYTGKKTSANFIYLFLVYSEYLPLLSVYGVRWQWSNHCAPSGHFVLFCCALPMSTHDKNDKKDTVCRCVSNGIYMMVINSVHKWARNVHWRADFRERNALAICSACRPFSLSRSLSIHFWAHRALGIFENKATQIKPIRSTRHDGRKLLARQMDKCNKNRTKFPNIWKGKTCNRHSHQHFFPTKAEYKRLSRI